VLGSDFPYQSGQVFTHGAVGFIGENVPEAEARLILDTNARTLLGLDT
jgi:predicted TIM-barrel fold metal-dependent hydrolase